MPEEIRMVKACPVCNSMSITRRKRFRNYFCSHCKNVFDNPIIRIGKPIRSPLPKGLLAR